MALLAPYKYKYVKLIKSGGINVLEAGVGNDSPIMFFKYNKGYIYDGLDKTKDCNLSLRSIGLINKFYILDPENDDLNSLANSYYDYLVIAHVIEHIENGEKVIERLAEKIKIGGVFYIEYPAEKSAKFPSMKGTLNFYDDPTHKRFYKIDVLKDILIKSGFEILKSGIKRDFFRIIGIPYMVVKSIFVHGYVRGSAFWDLLGFAEYIVARRIT
ncbi:MAG: methyltransferase domain-containing protein [Ignavibacteria bacterium]|nr:methyltransferase domain-containing protein [Ignavibacteria bacterium]